MNRMAGLALTLLLVVSNASARTWNITADGTGDAPTIQAAMDSTSAGDSVLVAPGTYPGGIPLVSGVALIGTSGPDHTTITAESTGVGLDGGRLDRGALTDVLIEGLTLTGVAVNGYNSSGCCAIRATGSLELRNCVVVDNISVTSAAIHVKGDLALDNCVIARNHSGFDVPWVGGIDFDGDGTGTLRITNCTIENCTQPAVSVVNGTLEVTDSVIRNNPRDAIALGPWFGSGHLAATIERNLFIGNASPIWVFQDLNNGILIQHNTFVNGTESGLGPFLGIGTVVHANVFAGNRGHGLFLCNICKDVEVTCNNSWGNHTTNWFNFPDPTGQNGNISEAPKFCDADGAVFTVAENSPCLPANNTCGIQMGALGHGCGPTSVTPETWARVKARYR